MIQRGTLLALLGVQKPAVGTPDLDRFASVGLLFHVAEVRWRPRATLPSNARVLMFRLRLLTAGLIAALAIVQLPARAARPLLDYHRLDAYFALYASDSNVPWRPASVRLDTYTSAPVQFAVYQD